MRLFEILPADLIQIDRLACVMTGLILFVFAIVTAHSTRYLAGDRNYRHHRRQVRLLAATAVLMVISNNVWLFLAAWATGNFVLARLMIHKSGWSAARHSGQLALRTFLVGSLLLGTGFLLLVYTAGSTSINQMNIAASQQTTTRLPGLLFIAVAAVTQTGVWPFHRWLTSSLNSPTPVSVLTQASLINMGGFVLVRFAPLYATESLLLHGLFITGLVTVVVGTFWKFVQSDIKRMLACSTMSQMGFVLMQFGMGLFAPAISHLCWHSLYKAYLLMSTGSTAREKRYVTSSTLSPWRLLFALLAGACGALTFTQASGISLSVTNTEFMNVALAFLCGWQLAAGLFDKPLTRLSETAWRLTGAVLVGSASGGLYGLSLRLTELAIPSLRAIEPRPMDALYWTGLVSLLVMGITLNTTFVARLHSFPAWKRLYMAALNGSQPHPLTVTANRTAYQS